MFFFQKLEPLQDLEHESSNQTSLLSEHLQAATADTSSSNSSKLTTVTPAFGFKRTMSSNHRAHITPVLLFAYMRGGSSLLGEVFNLNKNAFYWFEPLAAVFDKIYPKNGSDPHGRAHDLFQDLLGKQR